MQIKTVILSGLLLLSPVIVYANNMQDCGIEQASKCARFCSMHQGVQSCVIDVAMKMGTCTCQDGVSHSKQK